MGARRGPAPAVEMTPRLLGKLVAALKAGKSQQAIARETGLPFSAVNRWLAPVVEIMRDPPPLPLGAKGRPRITPEQIDEIGRRLATASSLRDIAKTMGLAPQTVNVAARPMIDAMREAGTLGSCECGRERFHPRICSRTATNPTARWNTPEQHEKRAGIVAQIMRGDTFDSIADRWGFGRRGAMNYLRWLTPEQRAERKAMEQARSYREAGRATLLAHRDPTYAIIAAAVPRWLSEATREDAISELYLAVLEGSVAEHDIATAARRFASQAAQQWESRFGPRSLDELAFDGGREALAAMIADPATLEPLEHRLSA